MKKSIWASLVVLFILALAPLATSAAPLQNLSWRAEYYDNAGLAGSPKLTRYEDTINHDWGYCSPSPDLPCDNFSARFTITRHFDEGTYLFLASVDDGIRVWLDGSLIIDAWDLGYKDQRKARVLIEETGNHQLQVAYFESTGRASLKLDWFLLAGEDDILGAWRGEYFTNRDLSGDPVLVRQDGAINFDWNSGTPSPKVTRDNFSVRWTRSIFLEAGAYTFKMQHDDGMRIYVDGKVIYDSWYDQGVTYQTRRVHLQGGHRTFVVEYYEHLGNAIAYVNFDGDPGNYDNHEPDGAEVIVDNTGSSFWWGGPSGSRYVSQGGYGSSFFWTYNSGAGAVNSGRWTPSLGAAGNYEVYAYIPGDKATTTAARYRVQHHGEWVDRVLNQSAYTSEWVSLGIYYFDGAGNEFVTLVDTTGEAVGTTQVAFDALKFTRR